MCVGLPLWAGDVSKAYGILMQFDLFVFCIAVLCEFADS